MIPFTKILFIVALSIFLSVGCDPEISKTEREKSFTLAKQSENLLKTNKLDSAESLIAAALKIYPGNYIAYNDRAYLKIQLKKPQQEIINDYKKAIELWPEYDSGLYLLANYYFLIYDYKNTVNISSRYLSLQLKKELDGGMLEHISTGISEKHLLQFDNS